LSLGRDIPHEEIEASALCILLPPAGSSIRPTVRGITWAGNQLPAGGFTAQLGDPVSRAAFGGWRGHAAEVRWTPTSAEIEVTTSLAGFPSLFQVEVEGWIGIVSSLEWLRKVSDLRLLLCRQAIRELCVIGFPVEYRTLVDGVSLLPAGRRFRITAEQGVRTLEQWEPDPDCTFSGLEQYGLRQMANFDQAVASLDLEGTHFSLSGGLDTRTIFAGLLRRGQLVPAFTVSGPRLSLDATIAADLCRCYGLDHQVVSLGEHFTDDLWKLSKAASLRSGGITSVSGAPQVYCYRELSRDRTWSRVLSGGLGTQLGQGGAQGISARPVDPSLLGSEILVSDGAGSGSDPWYQRGMRSSGTFDRRFLIQEENFFASQGGYLVGQSEAIQVTPYADADLIAAAVARSTQSLIEPKLSSMDPRFSAFGRRFFGTDVHSFQRGYIAQVGGAVASQPINYGWRAKGGISPHGLLRGAVAFAEDVLTSFARRSRTAEVLQEKAGIRGFSTHMEIDRWVRTLREPVLDLLESRHIRECAVLNGETATTAASSFFNGGSTRPDTMIALVDLLLLMENYGSELAPQP
jgi:hypothetical protein